MIETIGLVVTALWFWIVIGWGLEELTPVGRRWQKIQDPDGESSPQMKGSDSIYCIVVWPCAVFVVFIHSIPRWLEARGKYWEDRLERHEKESLKKQERERVRKAIRGD